MADAASWIAQRALDIDASGIRRVFDLAAKLKDPVNLSIGQPDFDVPQPVKDAAVEAIRQGINRYTVTQGIYELQEKVARLVAAEFPNWAPTGAASGGGRSGGSGGGGGGGGGFGTLITSGVSGGLMLAILTCVSPGDEVLIPDPCFVMYR